MRIQLPEKPFQIILVLVLGLFAFGWGMDFPPLLYAGMGIGLVAALSPVAAAYIAWAWMQLGRALGWVNGKVLLSLVFFLFLVPMGFIYRLGRKNPLHLKDRDDSLFQVRDHTYAAKDLKDAW